MRDIVPVRALAGQLPEHGRIRLGVKAGRAMRSIDTFRFTSPDKAAIDELAAAYGGEVKRWSDPKAMPPEQWEVITKTNRIRILLPPGQLSTNYELWGGGGCERRCDGLECTTWRRSDQEVEEVVGPCICAAQNVMKCRPYTRLNCILPEIRFAGIWRMETKGWNAAKEIGAMEQILASVQEAYQGPVIAVLALDKRSTMKAGRKSNFVVPRLEFEQSVAGLVSGQAVVTAASLGVATATPALPAGVPDDDEVAYAEVVEDEVKPSEWAEKIQAQYPGTSVIDRLHEGAARVIRQYPWMGPDDDACLDRLASAVSKGKVTDHRHDDPKLHETLERLISDILTEKVAISQEGDAVRIVRRS